MTNQGENVKVRQWFAVILFTISRPLNQSLLYADG